MYNKVAMEQLQALLRTAEGLAVALFLGGLLLLILSLLSLIRSQPKLHLPPSPSLCLPLLGHIFHLRYVSRAATLHALRQQLGPIFTLRVGRIPIIYITSASLAHEALVQKGLLFATRPLLPSRSILTSNFHNINSASYGPFWRSIRRNLVQEMFNLPRIVSFRPIRLRALDDLISGLLAEAQQNDGVVSIFMNIRHALFQLLLFMCFGFYLPKDSTAQISGIIHEVLLHSVGTLEDFYPFLHIFYRRRWQKARAVRAKQVQLYSTYIEKHKELQRIGQVAAGSYLETLLNLDASLGLSMDNLVTLCSEFITAGADTTVTTLEWTMARMVENPAIQSKVYDEIYAAVGDKPVEEPDLAKLPYLKAVVKEALRLHPPGHFLIPHATSKLCTVGGYDIPPDAIVQFHAISIAKDAEIWKEPLQFRPERFVNAEVDITGNKEMRMMPFGAGRRICPAVELAFLHMELFAARLLQSFEWSAFPAGSTVDLTERTYFTVHMENPLKAFLKQRKSPSN